MAVHATTRVWQAASALPANAPVMGIPQAAGRASWEDRGWPYRDLVLPLATCGWSAPNLRSQLTLGTRWVGGGGEWACLEERVWGQQGSLVHAHFTGLTSDTGVRPA